jgi:hypothetical protein
MKKINVALTDESHRILTDYKLKHGHNTLDAALNALLGEWERKNQLFRA